MIEGVNGSELRKIRFKGADMKEARLKNKRRLKEIEPILKKLKEYLTEIYGKELLDVILYGSFAKGKATKDSDIDIAIILNTKCSPLKEIDRISDFLNHILLEYGELVSVYPISKEEVSNSKWPLFVSWREGGVRL